jgi:predicted ATP-dependent protease
VKEGILSDIILFRMHPIGPDGTPLPPADAADPQHPMHERAFRKYQVNVLVNNARRTGAPVVIESNPTYPNLIGRIEREAVLGTLVSDFTLISAGALLRANGGYLILRVLELLRAPLSWEALKRSLRDGKVTIEDPNEMAGFIATRGLRPVPIPLDCKVFIVGEPEHYFLLYQSDPEFRDLFKVRADFASEVPRNTQTEHEFATFICGWVEECERRYDRTALAYLIEEASRLAEDQEKITAQFQILADILREAIYWADVAGSETVTAEHVRKAVNERRYRAAQPTERFNEAVARGILKIDPRGAIAGQIHGLAVLSGGDVSFGVPSKISVTVGAGRDGVIDIERQVELSGRIHSKGVQILSGYLTDHYAREHPLAVSARIVFEQSYNEVDGDSASMAELIALLSRIADVPIDQGIAVTGSINQHGDVQAIGGAVHKIEGFFDVCQATGLTGGQGVILPTSNVQHLMLREDVVAAVEAGQFHVWAANTVDEAIELLIGVPAKPAGDDGAYPDGTFHALVEAKLRHFAEALKEQNAPIT